MGGFHSCEGPALPSLSVIQREIEEGFNPYFLKRGIRVHRNSQRNLYLFFLMQAQFSPDLKRVS